jgi:hypothetical protein
VLVLVSNPFFSDLVEELINRFYFRCSNSFIKLNSHYLGAKSAAKSAKNVAEGAYDGTKDAAKTGERYCIIISFHTHGKTSINS